MRGSLVPQALPPPLSSLHKLPRVGEVAVSRLGGGGIVQQEGDGRGGGFAEFQEEGGAGSDVERTEEHQSFPRSFFLLSPRSAYLSAINFAFPATHRGMQPPPSPWPVADGERLGS
jgi:hypothetical protein